MFYELLDKLNEAFDNLRIAEYKVYNCRHLDEKAFIFAKYAEESRIRCIALIAEAIADLAKEIIDLSPYDKELFHASTQTEADIALQEPNNTSEEPPF